MSDTPGTNADGAPSDLPPADRTEVIPRLHDPAPGAWQAGGDRPHDVLDAGLWPPAGHSSASSVDDRQTAIIPVVPVGPGRAEAPRDGATSVLPTLPSGDSGGPSARATRLSVLAATLLFAAMCLGFLVNTPPLVSPDELYHFDRVIAAEHGRLVLAPEEINVAKGVRNFERTYVVTLMRRGKTSWAQYQPHPRDARPSLAALGGDARSPRRDVSNYMTQHPPLYYDVMGGLTRLLPGPEMMAADKLVLLIRLLNVLMVLPLPWLFHRAARLLALRRPGVAVGAAYLPLLVPGLARSAATINNDNLVILLGAAILGFTIAVLRGDTGLRTAGWLAVLCTLGSLTKGPLLLVFPVVAFAYVFRAVRDRELPRLPVLTTLGAGTIGAAFWWVRNILLFHAVQPSAMGTQAARASGSPRPADVPPDMGAFWHLVTNWLPSRLWGALGIPDPPFLPPLMVWVLSLGAVVAFGIAVVVTRGRRLELTVLFALPIISLGLVIFESWRHYVHWMAIAGIQGRYTYSSLVGLLLPIAIAVSWVLHRAARWTPAVIAAFGLLVTGWGLYTSVEYTWLQPHSRLVPSNWSSAYRPLAGFFPWGGAVLVPVLVLICVLVAAGIVLTVRACRESDADADPGRDAGRSGRPGRSARRYGPGAAQTNDQPGPGSAGSAVGAIGGPDDRDHRTAVLGSAVGGEPY